MPSTTLNQTTGPKVPMAHDMLFEWTHLHHFVLHMYRKVSHVQQFGLVGAGCAVYKRLNLEGTQVKTHRHGGI